MAKILVIGGAGYVGGSTCAWLLDQGHSVSVLDDLSTGYRGLVLSQDFIQARVGDRDTLARLFSNQKFDCVMHFAARALVGESVQKPQEYFENNVDQTRVLIETMVDHGVRNLIFSSTCAVFGDPGMKKLTEQSSKAPLHPYGATKLEVERMLEEAARSRGLKSIALRYFNAAGAEEKLRVGEVHDPETHLIPNVIRAALNGDKIKIHGTDYSTPDGTCIRDYVHVSDLARTHEAAMKRLLSDAKKATFESFNLGSEQGHSIRQVIAETEALLGIRARIEAGPRRPGDPPYLVADASLAKKELGFEARSLAETIQSAIAWEKKRALKKRAVFLDRDGTINLDPGYLRDPDQVKLIPGVPEALKNLKSAGFSLIVVSNQSGVARGLIRVEDMPKINGKLDELLREHGVWLDHYELCFHHPESRMRVPKAKAKADFGRRKEAQYRHFSFVYDWGQKLGSGRWPISWVQVGGVSQNR